MNTRLKPRMVCRRSQAFTLVELLIVVVILAVIAALVVPQFSTAARMSRETVLRDQLRLLRSQILVYATQHAAAPGVVDGGGDSAENFVAQMTGRTNYHGVVSPSDSEAHPFGPYLESMPVNPINELDTVRLAADGPFPAEPDATHGWVYQPSSLRIAADCEGSDGYGQRSFDY